MSITELEFWLPVANCPRYSVSNLGRVRGPMGLLKPMPDGYGYVRVSVFNVDKKHLTKKIHRLVAEAFMPNPDNKPQVNHLNGVKTDNRVSNLEWATAAENHHHALDTGLASNDRLYRIHEQRLAETHCKRGHLLDGRSAKQRFCKTCRKAAVKRWRAAKRANP